MDEDMKQALDMVVIYKNPSDHPQKFVARLWKVGPGWYKPTNQAAVVNNLLEARRSIFFLSSCPLIKLDRMPFDDACIVEVWM